MLTDTAKKWFVSCFLCFFFAQLYAQNTYLDSIRNDLSKKDLPDSTRIDNMLLIGQELAYSNREEAMKYMQGAYELASRDNLWIRTGDALSGIGLIYYRSDDPDSALYYMKIASPYYFRLHTPNAQEAQVSNKMNIATILRTMGNLDTAVATYLDGIRVIHESDFPNKKIKLLTAYMNLGLVYNELNQWDKALFYHRRGLQELSPETEKDIKAYYLKLHLIHDFIELNQLDSAAFYLNREQDAFLSLNQADITSQYYANLGMYRQKKGALTEALASYQKCFDYAKEANNKFRQEQMLARMGKIYMDQKNYRQSIPLFEKAVELSHAVKDKPSEKAYLKYLATLYTLTHNDHLAAINYQQYIHLNDSLNETESKKKINEIENKYQSAKKELRILSLEKDNKLKTAELKQKRTANMALITGCILLLLLAVLSYINFKNKNRLLKQREMLHRQKISEMENERKLLAAQSVLKGQEDERSRLARDLHDGVGGLLSGVKYSMSHMKGNIFLSAENAATFNNVISQLDQSISELRRVSHNMMPEALIKFGLKEALENYCESLNLSGRTNLKLQTYTLDERMEQATEIVIYRIIQELLNNVLKHAEAKNVLIQLVRENDRFNLTVEDDGKGFDITEAAQKQGAGLANIKARAEYLNGSVDIISRKGEGTSVHVEGDCNV